MNLPGGEIRLRLGQWLGAWGDYPAVRQRLKSVEPGPPVLVTGVPRSGTTWLGEQLADGRLWHLHEPFNPNQGFCDHNFVHLESEPDQARIGQYVRDLLRGRIIRNGPRILLRDIRTEPGSVPARLGLYRKSINRVLIKDPLCCLSANYLRQRYDFEVVVVIRHPAGVVSSFAKLNWDARPELKRLLANEMLMTRYLGSHRARILEASSGNDDVARSTLVSCLCCVLEAQCREDEAIALVQYEALCDQPEAAFNELRIHLGLPMRGYADEERKQVHRPELFTTQRDTRRMAGIWKQRLGAEQLKTIRNTWAEFELPWYGADEDWNAETTDQAPLHKEVERV